MSKDSLNTLILVGIVGVGAALLARNYMSKENFGQDAGDEIHSVERYHDTFTDMNFAPGSWISRPTFKAELDPRFDATREGGGHIKGAYGDFNMQAAPITPVGGYGFDMAKLGTVSGDAIKKVSGFQEGYTPQKEVVKTLQDKFGKGSTLEGYTSGKDLMPTPTMMASDSRDPSDPNTFMYDRYVTAQLKRRYGQTSVDFIRGDMSIAPNPIGWFDARPVQDIDVVQGYFSGYQDIQQATNLKDTVFSRAYPLSNFQQSNPFGEQSGKQIYNLV